MRYLYVLKNIFIVCVIMVAAGCGPSQKADSLSEENQRQILLDMKNYRDAWLRNDTSAIMNLVSPDLILYMPNTNGKPKAGKDSIWAFWFPKTDLSYPITEYEVNNEKLEGNGNLCIYSGISKLSWYVLKGAVRSDSTTVVSEFMNILRKEGGQWKLFRVMYNVKDNDYK